MKFSVLPLLAAVFLAACTDSSVPGIGPSAQRWHVTLSTPGGDLPFFLELTTGGETATATLINATERVTSDEVSYDDVELRATFRAFGSEIAAARLNEALVGSLTIIRGKGKTQVIPLRAVQGRTTRFPLATTPPIVDVSGRWAVTFREDDGTTTEAVGEFVQDGANLTGTFLTPTGDYRYLAGDVFGNTIRLSCFDGYHAFLFTAVVDNAGRIAGDFWSGLHWHETWTATRDDDATLPDALSLTYLKPGYDRFNFSFPDTSGRIVSLSDKKFRDKVVIVAVSGSWCPNCHDEAAFFAPYYRQNRDRGVEIVSLMYEHLESFEDAAAQVKAFVDRYDIEYDLLIAGISDKVEASKTLPMLNSVLAYPTTIFVDRSGKVRRIHTGFSGPGTGDHYRKLVSEITEYVDFLLSEPKSDALSTND